MTPSERRKADEADLRVVLGTPAGRRFLMRLITQSGLYSDTFGDGSQSGMAFLAGRRNVGRSLLEECKRVAPELYSRGMREDFDAQERDAIEAMKTKAAASDE